MNLKTGDRVRVSGHRGTVIATIEKLCPPRQLPQLPGGPSRDLTADIMEEAGVSHVAMISYTSPENGALVFAALHIRNAWQDIQGQALSIDPIEPN